jgi:ATP-dependent Clp protease adapter protein ClpS
MSVSGRRKPKSVALMNVDIALMIDNTHFMHVVVPLFIQVHRITSFQAYKSMTP